MPVFSLYTQIPPTREACSNTRTSNTSSSLVRCLAAASPAAPAPITHTRSWGISWTPLLEKSCPFYSLRKQLTLNLSDAGNNRKGITEKVWAPAKRQNKIIIGPKRLSSGRWDVGHYSLIIRCKRTRNANESQRPREKWRK